jgi:Cdc6-like AAA superfamily ATPase
MLGISNTIDALEKYCEKLKINVNEVTNIVFNPYTVEQLKEIIIDRLD